VQIAARQADPRTTMRYDLARKPRPTPVSSAISAEAAARLTASTTLITPA
jgi:hypothetical protein